MTTKVPAAMVDPQAAGVSAANTFTQNQTIQSTDAGASEGPLLTLDRNSASPATADVLGGLVFSGRDDGAATEIFAKLYAVIADATAGSEDGQLTFDTVLAGALATRFKLRGGLYANGLTDPGNGNVNANAYHVGGLAMSPVLQVVNTQTGALATGTTVIPSDDTIPQNTEGDEYMTLAITPKSASSKLKIDVTFFGTNSAAGHLIVALFQDVTAGALAAVASRVEAGGAMSTTTFTYYMTSGTTSATTFKVRAGGSAAGTTTFNGTAGARRFGGIAMSGITITELLA